MILKDALKNFRGIKKFNIFFGNSEGFFGSVECLNDYVSGEMLDYDKTKFLFSSSELFGVLDVPVSEMTFESSDTLTVILSIL